MENTKRKNIRGWKTCKLHPTAYFLLLLHCKTLLYSFLPLSPSLNMKEKKHQKLSAIHVDQGELTSCKELSCCLARRPTLLSVYFILIEQDSPEFY